ncbi:MAG: family NAD(P)-dependent oxidoreductase [Paucimonas sp.]|nr:family NAD(P)-dependent oxidoreductase [Paucimonas sp.]
MRVLVAGAAGMLGNTVFRLLSRQPEWEVFGTVRSAGTLTHFPAHLRARLLTHVDLAAIDQVTGALQRARPDVVINCAGLTKHLPTGDDILAATETNITIPHRLARLCALAGARLVHVSTDCVFSGAKGNYRETDFPDANDIYGRTKLLGEVDYPNAITLRTSIIGHELGSRYGLLEWFLSQEGSCRGYSQARFSGLPTVVLAEVIRDHVIPSPGLRGIYHVASDAIDKYSLLGLLASAYGKQIQIVPDDALRIDRSLDGSRFRDSTGWCAAPWPTLVARMAEYQSQKDSPHV